MEFVRNLKQQLASYFESFTRDINLFEALFFEKNATKGNAIKVSVTKTAGLVLVTLTLAYCG